MARKSWLPATKAASRKASSPTQQPSHQCEGLSPRGSPFQNWRNCSPLLRSSCSRVLGNTPSASARMQEH
eukprot:6824574-Lingulodinium_polyedra.AAC.1